MEKVVEDGNLSNFSQLVVGMQETAVIEMCYVFDKKAVDFVKRELHGNYDIHLL